MFKASMGIKWLPTNLHVFISATRLIILGILDVRLRGIWLVLRCFPNTETRRSSGIKKKLSDNTSMPALVTRIELSRLQKWYFDTAYRAGNVFSLFQEPTLKSGSKSNHHGTFRRGYLQQARAICSGESLWDSELRYANLIERVKRPVSHLHSLGACPEVIIAVALERGIERLL